MTDIKIKLLSPTASVPSYQTEGAAAADVCACLDAPITIGVGECALIPTGFAVQLEAGTVALIFARSGLATKKGLSLANSVGVIDSDYRGEVKIALVNRGSEPFIVNHGDRIAQMGIFPVLSANFTVSAELDSTERGSGGFGHTGI